MNAGFERGRLHRARGLRSWVGAVVSALLVSCATTSPQSEEPELEVTEYTLRVALEDLVSAQQDHYHTKGWYASTLIDLAYQAPPGVEVRIVQTVDPRGYYAIATGDGSECAVFTGTSHPPRHYLTRREQVGCGP